ncbi:hypothetical protein JHK82_034314 [Glycine max]|uniref:Uncharacterized protein n=1 Tax=Glycine max TaxID=3847 RepID=A0A0R0H7N9_SOYBN|nr:hypothetical protein JHK85_035022 [Glycine max]KAG5119894.1 hypothetical protein JHK82_034314 [Glycine max]KAH1143844.1 hypothetical protein GYH30_034182 [Glycine max]KRH26647.1 hypothetical protein GLYMA_12G185300v4 [Glycine max]
MHVNLPRNKILLVFSYTKVQIRLCQKGKKSLQDPSCQITQSHEFVLGFEPFLVGGFSFPLLSFLLFPYELL